MDDRKPSFEKSLARLDAIVAKLERGDVPLDDALGLYTEGAALVKLCAGLLDAAELKVMRLSEGDSGEVGEAPLLDEVDL
ncbi:MAG: exodeoxyribonuclease VII small subunit [Oscillospiraceae bacterium]|nr:exodeoxyribonuclease VII small subunit [Oscillospiraceae bacterium]